MIGKVDMLAANCDKCDNPLLGYEDNWVWSDLASLKEVAVEEGWQIGDDGTCLCFACKTLENI